MTGMTVYVKFSNRCHNSVSLTSDLCIGNWHNSYSYKKTFALVFATLFCFWICKSDKQTSRCTNARLCKTCIV